MTQYLADEGFRREIVQGVQNRFTVDVVTVQGVGLTTAPDEKVLEYAAAHQRILWTHDERTMLPAAWGRIARGEPLPGVIFVPWRMAIGMAIEQLILLCAAPANEMTDHVVRLPLR